MYEADVKPDLELAYKLLNSIDYSKHSKYEIAGLTGKAAGTLISMLSCHPDKELVWREKPTK